MANVKLNDGDTIKVQVEEQKAINTHINDINYIPGYKAAEEERRAYYEDFKKRVENGEFNGEQGAPGEKGEPGEPGKDGTMSFEELTEEQKASLKGDKGDKGEPGETGDSGVHIGKEEPTDDSNVWIDLDEELVEYATKEYVNEMLGVIENDSY